MSRRGVSLGMCLVALAVALLGCGLPHDGHTTVIDGASLPRDLSVPNATPGTRSGSTAPSKRVPDTVWVDHDELVASELPQAAARSRQKELVTVLTALVAGPTRTVRQRGFTTALAPDAVIHLVGLVDGVAVVDIDLGTTGPSPDQLPLAIGQIVLSATSVIGVRQVKFQHEGKNVSAPLPDGALQAGPLVRADYVALLKHSGSHSR